MISCLDAHDWDAFACLDAKHRLAAAKVDVPAMIAHAQQMLQPVPQDWLAKRLKALWGSTVPAGSLSASEWLRETGRLIKHLPFDIASHAIDEAVRNSERGFTPTAGEILKAAQPLLAERRRILNRLNHVAHGFPSRPEPAHVPPEERCTPEEAKAILAQFGLKSVFDPDSKPVAKNLREPTAEELEQIKREMEGGR